jgi:hypothetical protein
MREFLIKLNSVVLEEDGFDGLALLPHYLKELEKCLSLDNLKTFSPLILFLKHFYTKELESLEATGISET